MFSWDLRLERHFVYNLLPIEVEPETLAREQLLTLFRLQCRMTCYTTFIRLRLRRLLFAHRPEEVAKDLDIYFLVQRTIITQI